MATGSYTQEGIEDTHESNKSNESQALNLQTLSDALGNATLDEQIDMHPARIAAFATNELLHLVISHVPRGQRFTTLLRVSKTWNSVIRKTGYYTQPANLSHNSAMSMPVYLKGSIDFHPILWCSSSWRTDKWNNKQREWTMHFRVDNYYPSVLHRFGHQYLTRPPITHLSLTVDAVGHRGALASLRVKDGIRLRDVAEVLDKLRQSMPAECQYAPESETRFQDYMFTAHIFCARAGSQVEIRERDADAQGGAWLEGFI